MRLDFKTEDFDVKKASLHQFHQFHQLRQLRQLRQLPQLPQLPQLRYAIPSFADVNRYNHQAGNILSAASPEDLY